MNSTTYESPGDELLIQRFVDGELNDAEQREVLARCDSCPELYRRLALTFVENRLWDEQVLSETEFSRAVGEGKRVAGKRAAEERAEGESRVDKARASIGALGSWCSWAVSLAAMLVLGLFIGRQLVVAKAGPEARQEGKVAGGVPNGDPAGAGEFMWLVVNPADGGAPHSMRIPLVAAQDGGADKLLRSGMVTQEFLEQMQRAGYEFQQERKMVPFDFPDGRRVVVPVDNVRVRNVVYPEYQ